MCSARDQLSGDGEREQQTGPEGELGKPVGKKKGKERELGRETEKRRKGLRSAVGLVILDLFLSSLSSFYLNPMHVVIQPPFDSTLSLCFPDNLFIL